MGFPTWTLIGMGGAALVALIAIGVALLGQSPGTIRRLNLDGARLDLRVKAMTGWGFAFIVLAIGFFLAGVPLGPAPEPAADLAQPGPTDAASAATIPASAADVTETAVTPTSRNSVNTGAFGQPDTPSPTPTSPVGEANAEATPAGEQATAAAATPTPTPGQAATATPSPTASATATHTPTPSPSPTATATATPTLTPTPIEGETAVITTNGSTLWVRRTPGGAPLVIVRDGDLVLLLLGHANQGGIEWQEVQTLSGLQGWVQSEFLSES